MFSKLKDKLNGQVLILTKRKIAALAGMTLLVAAVIVWAVVKLNPLPPRTITLACGPVGSSYESFGKRYQMLLARQGIQVKLVNTAGGVQNLAMLSDPKSGVEVAFVEGGIPRETDVSDLSSLGTISYEPMWFFTRLDLTDQTLGVLTGKRISVGPPGSDSRALVDKLLKRNALCVGAFQQLELSPEDAADQLIKGKIDGAIIVTAWNSKIARQLVGADGIRVVDFVRADAYCDLFPSLTKVVLPMGVGNLVKNRPSHDKYLLATKTSLIVREDLHPAIKYLLLEAASKIHSRAGVFQDAGEFPAAEAREIPLDPDAAHYYKSGQPFLQRYLPFWIAALAEELIVLLLPLVGLMYPLWKGFSALYGWGMQRKIFLLYGELYWLESELDKLGGRPPDEALKERMRRLEERARRVKVAAKYIPMLYDLREKAMRVSEQFERQGRGA